MSQAIRLKVPLLPRYNTYKEALPRDLLLEILRDGGVAFVGGTETTNSLHLKPCVQVTAPLFSLLIYW